MGVAQHQSAFGQAWKLSNPCASVQAFLAIEEGLVVNVDLAACISPSFMISGSLRASTGFEASFAKPCEVWQLLELGRHHRALGDVAQTSSG